MSPRRSALPESLRARLTSLGDQLAVGRVDLSEFAGILDAVGQLPSSSVAKAGGEIATLAHLYGKLWPNRRPDLLAAMKSGVLRIFRAPGAFFRSSTSDQLDVVPDLGWLLIFDYDGYVREAALKSLKNAPPSPFFFAAIAYRLNDWAAPVRLAARDCAQRILPEAEAEVVAGAALYLLGRCDAWLRWGGELSVLDEAFSRSDVGVSLSEMMIRATAGPMARGLKLALRHANLDRHLPQIARQAQQPSVRAVAWQTLIDGRAHWPTGFGQEWIDKSLGVSRRVAISSHRDLPSKPPIEPLIREALRDRSAMVRRLAADRVLANQSLFPDLDAIAAGLSRDRTPSIRERGDLLLRKLAERAEA
jgi:hypothetical protein